MNKFALILGLSLSMSANAWTTIEQDAVVGTWAEGAFEGDLLLFEDVERIRESESPGVFEWCKLKGKIAVAVVNDREKLHKDEMLDMFSHLKPKMQRHLWVEIERIVNESRRVNQYGSWEIEDTEESKKTQIISEYQHCIVNGF